MDILLLTTPSQHSSSNPAVLLEAGKLSAWISKLPTKDVVETVRQLQSSIDAFNEIRLAPTERIKLLEIYYDAFQSILFFYDDMRVSQLALSNQEKKHLLEDIMWLYLALSQGYKIIVKQAYDEHQHPGHASHLLHAIFRSLELISSAVISAFRSQVSVPPLVFLEVHQLYIFANRHDAHETRVKNAKGHAERPTVDQIYKQLLLLVIANRSSLSSMALQELYMYLEPFATDCWMTQSTEEAVQDYTYLIDFMDDSPPKRIDDLQKVKLLPTQCMFVVVDALAHIDEWIQEQSNKDSKQMYCNEIELLSLFLNSFHVADVEPPKIAKAAVRQIKNVNILSGLPAVLNRLKKNRSRQDVDVQESGEIEHSPNVLIQSEDEVKLITPIAPVVHKIDLGEIIAVTNNNSQNQGDVIMLAAVEYMQKEGDNWVVGLDVLANNAVAITYSEQVAEHDNTTYYFGLYFPAAATQDKRPSLLIEKQHFSAEDNLMVLIKNKLYFVEPKTLIRDTEQYIQFRFKITKESVI